MLLCLIELLLFPFLWYHHLLMQLDIQLIGVSNASILSRWFPFLMNRACCEACGNLKAAFLVAVVS
jgi:hypothetical protein